MTMYKPRHALKLPQLKSGDVLARAIAGLMKLTPFAPLAGVYLHGTAGDIADAQKSEGLIATDIMNNLPLAVKNCTVYKKFKLVLS